MNWRRYQWAIVVALMAILPLPIFASGSAYLSRIVLLVVLFATAAMAVNITFGHTDQLLLFSGGMMGLSSYAVIIPASRLGVSPWLLLPVGALLVGAIGFGIVYLAARLEMDLVGLAILTFAVQLVVIQLANGLINVTGGVTGRQFGGLSIQPLLAPLGVNARVAMYYWLVFLFAVVLLFYLRLIGSTYGIAFEMIRQDDFASESSGIDVVRYKSLAGFISLFILGLVGPFYAQIQGFVVPSLFSFNAIDVLVLIMLILGGLRTTYGPLVGAVVIVFLNQLLSNAQQYRTAIYGLLLMGLFFYFRQGILPWVRSLLGDRLGLGGGRADRSGDTGG